MERSDFLIISAGITAMIGTAVGLSIGTNLSTGEIWSVVSAEFALTAAAYAFNGLRTTMNKLEAGEPLDKAVKRIVQDDNAQRIENVAAQSL